MVRTSPRPLPAVGPSAPDPRNLALVVDDPDAPGSKQAWVHWVGIAKVSIAETGGHSRRRLSRSPRRASPRAASRGRNSWGTVGYRGPPHRGGTGFITIATGSTAGRACDGPSRIRQVRAAPGHEGAHPGRSRAGGNLPEKMTRKGRQPCPTAELTGGQTARCRGVRGNGVAGPAGDTADCRGFWNAAMPSSRR